MDKILSVKNVTKIYHEGDIANKVVNEVSLDIEKSDFVIIMGVSGSGKTSLLAGIDEFDSGTISYLEIRFQEYSPSIERKFIKDAEDAFDMPLSDTIYTYDRIKAGYTSTYEMIGAILSFVSVVLAVMIVVMTLFLIQSDMSEDVILRHQNIFNPLE